MTVTISSFKPSFSVMQQDKIRIFIASAILSFSLDQHCISTPYGIQLKGTTTGVKMVVIMFGGCQYFTIVHHVWITDGDGNHISLHLQHLSLTPKIYNYLDSMVEAVGSLSCWPLPVSVDTKQCIFFGAPTYSYCQRRQEVWIHHEGYLLTCIFINETITY